MEVKELIALKKQAEKEIVRLLDEIHEAGGKVFGISIDCEGGLKIDLRL